MKKIALLFSLLSFNTFAYEVTCVGEIFSFTIEKQDDFKVGTISAQRQLLQKVVMKKESVKAPEYSNLKAFIPEQLLWILLIFIFLRRKRISLIFHSLKLNQN